MEHKQKLLLVGWEKSEWSTMLKTKLIELLEIVDVVFAEYIEDAIHEIAVAEVKEERPMGFVLFNRPFLVENEKDINLLVSYFNRYSPYIGASIGMVINGQDDIIDKTKLSEYAMINEWKSIFELLRVKINKKTAL